MRDFLVLAKPAGPRCDLRCDYCYYAGNETALRGPGRPKPPGRMDDALLERYVAQRFEAGAGSAAAIHFEWHGGEPSLLGLDWFKRLLRLQRRLAPPGADFSNGLQTNGLGLNAAWSEFLAAENWSVGLSLDGPPGIHDAYRRTIGGEPSHDRVLRAYEALRSRGVFVNLLCVLTRESAARPEEAYGFFRGIGARYLQFLPLVTPASGAAPHPAAADPEAIGAFLRRVFDLWIARDLGSMAVQNFDEALRPLCGLPHALCVHRERCGDVLALERDGSLYACDHFVDPGHRLGDIRGTSLSEMAEAPALAAFGEEKRAGLSARCRSCDALIFCNGGCPKDRIVPEPEGGKLNYLCPAYRGFFAHAKPALAALASHIAKGLPLRSFRASGAGSSQGESQPQGSSGKSRT